MIMADVFAIFGTLLALGIALPGLLLTWQLLLPNIVERAHQRLTHTPWLCFFTGGVTLGFVLIPILILANLPWGGFRAMAAGGALLVMTIASFGAAGAARLMGERLQRFGFAASTVSALIRGAISLELAAAFPLDRLVYLYPADLYHHPGCCNVCPAGLAAAASQSRFHRPRRSLKA